MKLTGDHCQCCACKAYFNSSRAFDKHRIGDVGMRRCRTPDVMEALGMSQNAKGYWITSKRAFLASAQGHFTGDREKSVPVG